MSWFRSKKREQELIAKQALGVAEIFGNLIGDPNTAIHWKTLPRDDFLVPWVTIIALSKIFAPFEKVPWQPVLAAAIPRVFAKDCYGGVHDLRVVLFIAMSAIEHARDAGYDLERIFADMFHKVMAGDTGALLSGFLEIKRIAATTSLEPHSRVGQLAVQL